MSGPVLAVTPKRFTDVPPRGVYLDGWHRYWQDGEGPFPSVTGITGIVDKPFLLKWASDMTAALAIENAGALLEHLVSHVDAPEPDCLACLPGLDVTPWDAEGSALRWLSSASTRKRDSAADFGTRIHAHAEALTYGAEPVIAPEERPAVDAFLRWRDDYRPQELEAEFQVISLRFRYGGTADYLGTVNGYVTLIDFKSGKSIPTEIDLQLAGYGGADGIAQPNVSGLTPLPRIERHAVLHIRPDAYDKGYAFEYVPVTGATFERFLDARRLYDWKKARDKQYRDRRNGVRDAAA